MSEELYSTWATAKEKANVWSSNSDAYDNNSLVMPNRATAYRTYLDIEPNRSVRTTMTRNDYYKFRPEEHIPSNQKKAMKMCMEAYDRVGIVRNVIDLMGDFACQGISIVHPNKTIERFYRAWFTQVNGIERSERFLNYLYRIGNVVVKRRTAKITAEKEAELKRVVAADMKIENVPVAKREIPWQYDFLNPLVIDVLNHRNGLFIGDPEYVMNLTQTTYDSFSSNKNMMSKLPEDLKLAFNNGKRQIILDKSKIEVFHYKKDDWLLWANPMIYAILDDLVMLDKMKMADLAALDGAISQVRLWRLGSLEHQIVPRKDSVNKLRDILASNTGGGTIDLVWGPELDFKESESQVYKFLGSEKYQPVLTSIYAGLGIPPTLTGAAGSSGGYSNNYVSLKTLIERLEYGRQILTQFWQKELDSIQKAMGFRLPAQIRFDTIILSDESAEKQLLINLADRDIISHETILERFGEHPNIEKVRVRREEQDRRDDHVLPRKASPYHNPNMRSDIAKILITKDGLKDSFYKDLDLPKQDFPENKIPPGGGLPNAKKPTPKPAGGRPSNSKDAIKRKTKVVKPKSSQAAQTLWVYNAQKAISEIVTPMVLDFREKKNVRSLSKAEFNHFEYLKLCILASIEPFIEVTPEIVADLIKNLKSPSLAFVNDIQYEMDEFVYINKRKPTVDEMKYIYATAYINQLEVLDEEYI